MSTREFVDTRIYKQFKTKLFTNILAKVVNVENYEEWGMIDVRPCIADVWEEDGSAIAFPLISNVPVMVYSGGGAVVTIPLAVGDTVTLQVTMRNIDAWKQGDEEEVNVPIDSRMFNLTDSIAIPCVYSKTTSIRPNPDDLELRYNESIIRLKKNGDITIDTKGNIFATVAKNLEAVVEGDMDVSVEGDAFISVNGDVDSTIGGSLSSSVGQNASISVEGQTSLNSVGSVSVSSGSDISLSATGSVNITQSSGVTIDNSGTTEINSSGNVSVNAPTVNIEASVTNLGAGGQAIARLGDSVQVNVTSGSSSGTWSGTITSAGTNTSI